MKIFRILYIAALCFSPISGAEESVRATFAQNGFDVSQHILSELRLAPKELVNSFVADEQKLKAFITGRLQDMAMADYARERGLDQEPNLFARRLVEERSELVRAAVLDFQQAEQARLPDLEPLAHERYLATRQQFAIPEQIRVAHILLRADVEIQSDEEIAQQKVKAEQVKIRLAAGDDFAALAREFSEENATAQVGGELPQPAKRGSFVPPFDKAAWALGEGETSDVVRTRFGFHIIKLLERKPASYKAFEQVRNELVQAVQNDILAPRRSAFVDSFRGPALDAKASLLLPEIQQALKESLASAPGDEGDAAAARADEAQSE